MTILRSVVLDPAATRLFELRTTGPASLHRDRLGSTLATWRRRDEVRMRHARVALAALLCAGLGVTTSACGADDTAGPASPPSSAQSTAAPETTAPTEPPPRPATGPLLSIPVAQVRAPGGWRIVTDDPSFKTAYDEQGLSLVRIDTFPQLAADPDLDRMAATRLESLQGSAMVPVTLQGPYELEGVEARLFTGRQDGNHLFELLALVDDAAVSVTVDSFSSAEVHRKRVEAVLASFRWR